MGSTINKRRLVFSALIIACGLGVCAWQAQEHLRRRRNIAQGLINRGKDITSTLGVLLRSQRRFGIVSKERLQPVLEDLVRSGELESIAILGADGQTIASAGAKLELTPEMLQAPGPYWRARSLTILNPMDLDPNSDDGARSRPPIVLADERTVRTLRPPLTRRPPSNQNPEAGPAPAGETAPPASPAADPRPGFTRPSSEEYAAVLQKGGVHSLVVALSTEQMQRTITTDLWLRSLVSLFAMGGVIVSTLAWRNVARNSELQIRLVKAGEMNLHLKQMNLAAAGLAHETRNPLNLIRGLAQMITLHAKDEAKLREHATAIIEETDRVTVQLNEFINFSKPREPQPGPVAVKRLVADLVRTLVPDIEEKRITVLQPESNLLIEADEQLLRQALFNVLLNATQAVEPGGRIEVKLEASGPREAILEVRDDGPGVAAGDRAEIFKPYVTMRPKGVGLGLAIVSQIAAAHHWDIACDANEPRGAVFRFSHLKIAGSTA
jgi:signal transduction histidine kinase